MDVRVTYSYVKATLLDPTVNKVVIIAHSQGGIIISLVLDQLFTEMPANAMSKLEIYTFGSAASHFSNPLVSPSSETEISSVPPSPAKVHFDRPRQPKHVISHIEHYANEKDMVPRWGVLHCVQSVLNNRYAGSVFVRMGGSGHMFNQHYMDPMFPLEESETLSRDDSFLERVVIVDEKLATKRETVGVSNMELLQKASGLEFGNGQVVGGISSVGNGTDTGGVDGGSSINVDTFMTFARTDTGRLLAQEARGKTVRELSRLWRYQGGRSPHTPTPFPSVNSEEQLFSGSKNVKQGKVQGLAALNVNRRNTSGSDVSQL